MSNWSFVLILFLLVLLLFGCVGFLIGAMKGVIAGVAVAAVILIGLMFASLK